MRVENGLCSCEESVDSDLPLCPPKQGKMRGREGGGSGREIGETDRRWQAQPSNTARKAWLVACSEFAPTRSTGLVPNVRAAETTWKLSATESMAMSLLLWDTALTAARSRAPKLSSAGGTSAPLCISEFGCRLSSASSKRASSSCTTVRISGSATRASPRCSANRETQGSRGASRNAPGQQPSGASDDESE
eukprot:6206504-Pleurochrysis_carterae.AAC.1